MTSVEFEICTKDKVEALIDFIDKHWKQDHVFVINRELFNWQHKSKDLYNFVLAVEDENIIGILGFIPTSQFSDELIVNNEISEARIQSTLSECLKGKRHAMRQLDNNSRVIFSCVKT